MKSFLFENIYICPGEFVFSVEQKGRKASRKTPDLMSRFRAANGDFETTLGL